MRVIGRICRLFVRGSMRSSVCFSMLRQGLAVMLVAYLVEVCSHWKWQLVVVKKDPGRSLAALHSLVIDQRYNMK